MGGKSGSARGSGMDAAGLMDSKRMYVLALVISGGGGGGSGVSCTRGVGAWGERETAGVFKSYAYAMGSLVFV